MTTGGEGPTNRQPEDIELREGVEHTDDVSMAEVADLVDLPEEVNLFETIEPRVDEPESPDLAIDSQPSLIEETYIDNDSTRSEGVTLPEIADGLADEPVIAPLLDEDLVDTPEFVSDDVSEFEEPPVVFEHVPSEIAREVVAVDVPPPPGLERFGLDNVSLLEGETVDRALNLGEDGDTDGSFLLLTNRRIIHIFGPQKARSATFASVRDVDVVEVTHLTEGNGAYYWAAAAFVVAFFLWRMIDHALGSLGAAAVVALMGVYLIADKLLSPGKSVIVFRVGSREFNAYPAGDDAIASAFEFANHVFEAKESTQTEGSTDRPFAPR